MAAADALAVLVDPDNLVKNLVTIPEGLRVVDIVDLLVEKTDIPPGGLREGAGPGPTQLGLPDYAEGNPEGYLFPATYEFGPKPTAKTMLTAMVDALAAGGRRRRPRGGGRRAGLHARTS